MGKWARRRERARRRKKDGDTCPICRRWCDDADAYFKLLLTAGLSCEQVQHAYEQAEREEAGAPADEDQPDAFLLLSYSVTRGREDRPSEDEAIVLGRAASSLGGRIVPSIRSAARRRMRRATSTSPRRGGREPTKHG
jgi:hypothetical protein